MISDNLIMLRYYGIALTSSFSSINNILISNTNFGIYIDSSGKYSVISANIVRAKITTEESNISAIFVNGDYCIVTGDGVFSYKNTHTSGVGIGIWIGFSAEYLYSRWEYSL